MGLVTNMTRRVEIPHEQGEWVEIRRLSWKQLEQASDVQSDAALARMKALGGDVLAALQKAATGQKQEPTAAYDRGTVLRAGILKWSYPEAVSPETIDQLDEQTATWAFREILALNDSPTDEERKNGLSPSTSR